MTPLAYRAENNGTSISHTLWSIQWSLCVASFYPGAILGFVLVPFSIRRLGIRWTYIISAIPAVIGCIINCFAVVATNQDPADPDSKEETLFVALFMAGRALVGIHGGAAVALLPLWTREVSPPPHRGFLSAFQQVAQAATTLIGLFVGSPSLTDVRSGFEVLQIIALVPTVLFVILLIFLPETPHHYFHRKPDWNKGEKSIIFYYCGDSRLEFWTLSILREWGTQETQRYSLTDLLRPKCRDGRLIRKGFLLGSVAGMSYAFTADDLIDSYSSDILQDLGVTIDIATAFTILLGVILLISSIFGCWCVEKLGRRITLIGGLFCTAITNSLAVLFMNISSSSTAITYACVAALCLTKMFIGLGAGAPAWFLASELVTPNARTLAQTISTAFLLGMSGVVTAVFMILDCSIGSYSILVLASIPALLCAAILALFMPETRGKNIDMIMLELDRGKKLDQNFLISYNSEPRYGTFTDENGLQDSGISLSKVNGEGIME